MRFNNKIYIIGFALSVLMFLHGCDKTWDEHYNTLDKTTEKDKIISEMEKIPEISKFTEAVKGIDTLTQLLEQSRLYTAFAPVNETFEKIDAEILNNDTLLTRLLLYHFIDGKFKYKDFESSLAATFNQKYLNISVSGGNVLLDNLSSIVKSDFLSQNGMIQVIDKPLLPLDNLHEYLIFNPYTRQFSKAIPNYTTAEFDRSASTPIGENENNELIYDSVFIYSNPFLYWEMVNPPVNFYGREIDIFMDISDEDALFTFVFPENYAAALNTAKNSPFLNKSIADHHWAGPVMGNLVMNDALSKNEIINEIKLYHKQKDVDSIKIWLYIADLLASNYTGEDELSNGRLHRVDGFEYDLGFLIMNQGNMKAGEKDKDYLEDRMADMTTSDNLDTLVVEVSNIKSVFHYDTINTGYESKYGEWVNFELEGDFYPVDYKILTRGQNFASGTFKVEANGQEIGEYNFATAPSGNNDTQFDEIGTVSFNEIKSSTNLKFTFVKTHPETNKGEQYLWIREIKFAPIIK